ncbi:MAG: hypothetical protein KJ052_21875, partial [Candidatus Hydrogenedentes bacterium]|nr:hypothetical protein [Candidatus Hydrogenedentota bacterium]
MSLTGMNADHRYRIAPDDVGAVLAALADMVSAQLGAGTAAARTVQHAVSEDVLQALAARLAAARGKSLVLCGSQDVAVQRLCNKLNQALANYGSTLEIAAPSNQKQGSDQGFATLLEELTSGTVDALFIAGMNPVYEISQGQVLADGLKKTELVVYCGERPNETSGHAGLICPDHHFLESWGDVEAVKGIAALRQPLIRPLFNTRSLLESINLWTGTPVNAYDAIQAHWRTHVYPRTSAREPFQVFWDKTLHDGWIPAPPAAGSAPVFLGAGSAYIPPAPAPGNFTLVTYPKVGLLDGRHAYNPWLQELPDPVSKITWDNYACLSVATAKELGVAEGDVVRIEAEGVGESLELPVYVQPGQHDRVVAVALGYGQATTARFAGIGPQWIQGHPTVGADGLVGKRVNGFLGGDANSQRYERPNVRLTKTGETMALAATQTHHTITVPENLAPAGSLRRPIVQETTLEAYRNDPHAGSPVQHHEYKALYPEDHPKDKHHWAMAIDLTTCTGCSACVIACQAENNIPVVGKDEVQR